MKCLLLPISNVILPVGLRHLSRIGARILVEASLIFALGKCPYGHYRFDVCLSACTWGLLRRTNQSLGEMACELNPVRLISDNDSLMESAPSMKMHLKEATRTEDFPCILFGKAVLN